MSVQVLTTVYCVDMDHPDRITVRMSWWDPELNDGEGGRENTTLRIEAPIEGMPKIRIRGEAEVVRCQL